MSSGLAGIECTAAEGDITWQEFLKSDGELLVKVLSWLSRL